MKFSGMKCPKCQVGVLERWTAGDEEDEKATWTAYRCTACDYVLKIKHVD